MEAFANTFLRFRALCESGADGFVFGCLTENGDVDEAACQQLISASKKFPCTFHRAFDMARNPKEAMRSICQLGFSRLLTSGQEISAEKGEYF